MNARLSLLTCLVLLLAAAPPGNAASAAAKRRTTEKVSFCNLLARPAAYSGRLVVTTVHIHMFKEGVGLSSPECGRKAVWLFIESKSGPGIAELSRWISPHPYYARRALVATLTGTLDLHYYDEITHRTKPVFKVIAAKDIKRPQDVQRQ